MAGYPHIERYRADLERIIAFGGSNTDNSDPDDINFPFEFLIV